MIKVATAVDWVAGEEIVITSSSYEHSEAERRTIASISNNKKEITLTKPLKYRHSSGYETFGSQAGAFTTEVGLLTRNIKIQGDSTSTASKYGAHVMMFGSNNDGLVSRIEYVEFSNCGQQKTLKSCISFNRNSDLSKSIVRGNSIHNSHARAVALKSSSYLTIEDNVAYQITGHGIFLETGLETNNVIRNNLIISTLKVNTLFESDVYPASFYITHPTNTLEDNRAAGSDGHGIYYNFGYPANRPSIDTIPITSKNNVVHSNQRAGLRIYRTLPATPLAVWPVKNTF